jgi:predicted DNA-binding transcriptional regulator YafY
LKVPYSDPAELELEILRHGENVEVIEPAKLRARIAKRLADAAKLYGEA